MCYLYFYVVHKKNLPVIVGDLCASTVCKKSPSIHKEASLNNNCVLECHMLGRTIVLSEDIVNKQKYLLSNSYSFATINRSEPA